MSDLFLTAALDLAELQKLGSDDEVLDPAQKFLEKSQEAALTKSFVEDASWDSPITAPRAAERSQARLDKMNKAVEKFFGQQHPEELAQAKELAARMLREVREDCRVAA